MVVALETGGRWSSEAVDFIWQLAQAKAREVPSFITHQTALVWERRWTRMLSTVCVVSFLEVRPWWNLRNLLLGVQLMGTRHLGQRF